MAYDTPMVGWKGNRVNTLRLWSARSIDPIHLDAFNSGNYEAALASTNKAEILCRVLYPADFTPAGKELRLRQEYLLHLSIVSRTSCAATCNNIPTSQTSPTRSRSR